MANGPTADWHGLVEIAEYHNDVIAALERFFTPQPDRLEGSLVNQSAADLEIVLANRRKETDLRSCLVLLASIEASFRVDYGTRCSTKRKDPLSRDLRLIYKKYGLRVSFEDDLLRLWVHHYPVLKPVVGELRGAMKYRHWIAHGRYWQPRLGKRYDFTEVYVLALAVQEQFPFVN